MTASSALIDEQPPLRLAPACRSNRCGVPAALALLGLVTLAGSLRAQDDTARVVTGQNPTQVVSQLQPYVIAEQLSNDVEQYSIVPSGTLALARRLQVQATVPYVFRTAGDSGIEATNGFGDPQWEVIFAQPIPGSKRVRMELALGGYLKVAPPDRGNGAWVMQPTIGVSVDIMRHLQLISVVTYQFSFDEDPGVAPISSLLGQVFLLWQPIAHSYAILQLNPGVDLTGDEFVHNAQLQLGRFVNKAHTNGPWLQFAFNTGQKNSIYPYSVQVQAGWAWLFPKAGI